MIFIGIKEIDLLILFELNLEDVVQIIQLNRKSRTFIVDSIIQYIDHIHYESAYNRNDHRYTHLAYFIVGLLKLNELKLANIVIEHYNDKSVYQDIYELVVDLDKQVINNFFTIFPSKYSEIVCDDYYGPRQILNVLEILHNKGFVDITNYIIREYRNNMKQFEKYKYDNEKQKLQLMILIREIEIYNINKELEMYRSKYNDIL